MSKLISAVIPAAIFLAGPALAQDPNIDINGDGMYSYPELTAVMPDLTDTTFEVLDTSGDGLLNADEIANGQAAGLLPR
ncbi:hypothetical protein SAMN04488005_1636 [Yoonia tamlensis]|uniref:EF hand n=1 Tax=Yoonia tamlensis TaxID=390270 RepID=A0A1I6GGL8_9RHOB|nr:hypothetical protein [Yoonia tamlensis]SFR41354.1 hypothetical protein SAMN04488005_1636 [Yoonia tamlensis]